MDAREESELFRLLVQNCAEIFWVVDPRQPSIFYISPGFESVWGRPSSVLAHDVWDFISFVHPDDRAALAPLRNSREPFSIEHRILRPDGSIRWISTRGVPIKNAADEVYRVAGISEDITARKTAEAALRQNERFLTTLLSTMPDTLFTLRRDLSFANFHSQGPKQRHTPPSLVHGAGDSMADLLPPDAVEEARRAVALALDAGEPTFMEYTLDALGGPRVFEARFSAYGPDEVLAVARDVTPRKRAEKDLRESELRFRLLADTSFEGVAILERGHISACNETFARLFDRTVNELMGVRALRLVAPQWQRFVYERFRQNAAFEFMAQRHDGTTFWLEYRGKHIPYDGTTVHVSTVRDTTERRHHEEMRRRFIEQIIAAQEDERRRIARELHDTMAQSLTSLAVGLRALSDLITEPDANELLTDLRQLAGATIEEAQRLARGLRPSVLDDLGFAPAVERLVSDVSRGQGFVVDTHMTGFDTPKRMPATVETALYRILQEALTNVARHARAASVDLLIERHPTHVRAIVEDNGLGFDPNDPHHPPKSGRGLGLLGIYERAALLHGQARIDSSPGHGTTLSVHIPLTERTSSEEPEP